MTSKATSKPLYKSSMKGFQYSQKKLFNPLFPVSRFFGLFPYCDAWEVSEGWFKVSVTLLVTVVVLGAYQVVYGIFMPDEIMVAAVFNIVLHIVRAVTEIASISCHLFSITRCTDDMTVLMRYLGRQKEPGVKIGRLISRYWTSIALNNWVVGAIMLNLYSAWTKSFERRILIISISITNTYIGLIAFLFCSVMEVLTSELKHLHSLVNKSGDIKKLIRQHQTLNSLSEVASRFYSFQLLFYCIRISVTVVQDIHLTIQQFLKPSTTETISFLSMAVLQGMHDLFFLHLITAYSQSWQDESLKFYSALTRRVIRSHVHYNDREITTYLSMKMISKPTAAGFFELNSSVFASVVGGCITYSVIVIQLSKTGE